MNNRSGFSLIELTVTLGISGMITFMMMKYSLTSYNQDAQMRYLAKVNETMSTIQTFLSKPEQCTTILKGKTISPTGDHVVGGLALPVTGGIKQILQVAKYADFEVTEIKLSDSAFNNDSSFDLMVTFTPRTPVGMNSFFTASQISLTKRLTIIGSKNGATSVKSCGAVVSDTNVLAKSVFCGSLGDIAEWDGATCKLKPGFRCDPGFIPRSITNLGKLDCIHIGSQVIFTKIFDFNARNCPTKVYSLYQTTTGQIAVGCPTPIQKASAQPILP